MKKITVIFIIIGVLAIAAYVVVRRALRTPGFQPPAAKGSLATKGPESPLDLRPRLITKLQQLVSQGSNGLYQLSIHSIEPDVLASTVSLKNIRISPDTAALLALRKSGTHPADLFVFSLDSLSIKGIGINDLLQKDVIDLNSILLQSPVIEIYHEQTEDTSSTMSSGLYERLARQLKHLSIGQLTIKDGRVTVHQFSKKKATRFNDVEASFSNILIDSTTQHDKQRFLFAKEAHLSTKNIGWRTADNLYDVKVGEAAIDAVSRRLSLSGLRLAPLYSKQEFQNHIKVMTERFDISSPSIELHGVDWWNLLNEDVLEASSADIASGTHLGVYLDHRKPSSGKHYNTFPHQILMGLHLKINIPSVRLAGLQVESEEFSPLSDEGGTLYVNDLKGTVTNLTNMPAYIRRNGHTKVQATATFMHSFKASLGLDFDLAHYRQGVFGATLSTRDADPTVINSLSVPMGLFRVERGMVQSLEAGLTGNNSGASGWVKFRYTKLRIAAMEKDKKHYGEVNKKHITSVLANVIVVKDDNPSGDKPARESNDAQFAYDHKTSFFNLIWKTTFVGILDIIGAPRRLANPH